MAEAYTLQEALNNQADRALARRLDSIFASVHVLLNEVRSYGADVDATRASLDELQKQAFEILKESQRTNAVHMAMGKLSQNLGL